MIIKLRDVTKELLGIYETVLLKYYGNLENLLYAWNDARHDPNRNAKVEQIHAVREMVGQVINNLRGDIKYYGRPLTDYRPKCMEICTEVSEVAGLLGITMSMAKPVPRTVALRKNKDLNINTVMTVFSSTWKKEKEVQLAGYMKAVRKLKGKKRGEINEAMFIRSLRQERQVGQKGARRTMSVEITRGPFNTKFTVNMVDKEWLSAVRSQYREFIRTISHERRSNRSLVSRDGALKAAGVYMTTNQFYHKALAKKAKAIFENKAPRSRDPHVGIELELIAKVPAPILAGLLMKAGLTQYVCLKTDGSLRVSNNGDHAHEVTAVIPEKILAPTVATMCAVLHEAGAYVNRTCGFHVHLDMRNRDPNTSYQRLLKASPVLYAMLPWQRRMNKHCKPNDFNTTFSSQRALQGGDRYFAINPAAYERHKTIEIRCHTGTVNPTKVLNWCQLLIKIVDTEMNKIYLNPKSMAADLKLGKQLTAYVLSRVSKFTEQEMLEEDEYVQRIYTDAPEPGVSRSCNCARCVSVPRSHRGVDLDAIQERDNNSALIDNEGDLDFEAA